MGSLSRKLDKYLRLIETPTIEPKLTEECRVLEQSLYAFVKASWPAIEGNTPFISNWHIEAICEHLESAIRGEIKKLLISVPPRTSKTTIISIMWPAWVWIKQPAIKFLFSSYAQKISWEHSRLCRMLIESPWYQERWGHIVQLSKDQATKGHFTNSSKGHRIATSVGAGGTALGGDVLVLDDPNEAGESETVSNATNDWVSRVWPSRLNPGGLGVNVLVQQRTREMDVSGFILGQDIQNEWVKLILPMEFEPERCATTIVLPSTNGKVWKDPRTVEGELLCPAYLNAQDIQKKKIELGSYNYATQYQQRPAPEEGGIFQKSWFQWWKQEKPPTLEYVIQSWDTALTANEQSAYSACTTWGLYKDINKITNLMLISAWRGRVTYPDLLKRAQRLRKNWGDIGDVELKSNNKLQPDYIIIEAKASGYSLVSDFSSKGIPVHAFNPDKYGDKIQRVHRATPYVEAGLVWVAAQAPKYTFLRKDHEMLVENCATFPNAESRDLVDSMTQAIICITKEKGLLKHVLDFGFDSKSFGVEYQPGYTSAQTKDSQGMFTRTTRRGFQ